MKKQTWKEKLRYWFDVQMSNGSLGLIKLLAISTAVVSVLGAVILHLAGLLFGEADFLSCRAVGHDGDRDQPMAPVL